MNRLAIKRSDVKKVVEGYVESVNFRMVKPVIKDKE